MRAFNAPGYVLYEILHFLLAFLPRLSYRQRGKFLTGRLPIRLKHFLRLFPLTNSKMYKAVN